MTITQIQGHLRQLLSDKSLTKDQKYSVSAAIECMEIVARIAPGISKAVAEHKNK